MVRMFDINKVEGFEWDAGNIDKNWLRHRVTAPECEEPFFNKPLFIKRDTKHSHRETRFAALGQTHQGRKLFVSFIVRGNKIRIISARDQSKKERSQYAKIKKNA